MKRRKRNFKRKQEINSVLTYIHLLQACHDILHRIEADLKDVVNHKQKDYDDVIQFITYNPLNPDLLAYEKWLESRADIFDYLVFKYVFRDGLSQKKAAKRLNDIHVGRISEAVGRISSGIRFACKI